MKRLLGERKQDCKDRFQASFSFSQPNENKFGNSNCTAYSRIADKKGYFLYLKWSDSRGRERKRTILFLIIPIFIKRHGKKFKK